MLAGVFPVFYIHHDNKKCVWRETLLDSGIQILYSKDLFRVQKPSKEAPSGSCCGEGKNQIICGMNNRNTSQAQNAHDQVLYYKHGRNFEVQLPIDLNYAQSYYCFVELLLMKTVAVYCTFFLRGSFPFL